MLEMRLESSAPSKRKRSLYSYYEAVSMTITIIPNWPLRHRLRHTATSTQVAQARLRNHISQRRQAFHLRWRQNVQLMTYSMYDACILVLKN